MRRLTLLWHLWRMNDEAFSWLLMAMLPSSLLRGAHAQIWPDGLGGFTDSQRIDAARRAAQTCLEPELVEAMRAPQKPRVKGH